MGWKSQILESKYEGIIMKVSALALLANISACNGQEYFFGREDSIEAFKDIYESDLVGQWASCTDIGGGFFVKSLYTFNKTHLIASFDGKLYNDQACHMQADTEAGPDKDYYESKYFIESAQAGIFHIKFQSDEGMEYFTSIKVEGDSLLEASSLNENDGSSSDKRADYYADSIPFQRL